MFFVWWMKLNICSRCEVVGVYKFDGFFSMSGFRFVRNVIDGGY